MELIAVAAISDNLAIGVDGELPWESIPADKQQYRDRIADATVILGRRTFESMRDDLPGRRQIVLSRSVDSYEEETATVFEGVEAAIEHAAQDGAEVAYVIGGATIYEQFLPHLDRLILSRVPGDYEADTYFPRWDRSEWRLVSSTPYEAFTLEEWTRES